MDTQFMIEFGFLIVALLITRVLYLVHKVTTGFSKYTNHPRKNPCKTVICIGSGGHTTEMIALIQNLDFNKYSPRYYVMASNDETSEIKIKNLENEKSDKLDYSVIKIPRSRIVGQSYISSIFSTVYSIIYCIPIVFKIRPDLNLCNGPGTCIPICIITFLFNCAFLASTKIVFIESICRTESFSLSGKILIYFADNFLVQWPSLKKKLKRAEYIGKLV
ncbi:UDP-N-acetylglucosamine transferase subunit ALG14 homolog [Cylas formicarius]|uniref:UDP-N-acetylglucosamine transferase subunit ALG14 homolog n=1 Tax=Cylas formicarius TaxID=197179 RepID=UPI002958D7E2|nr:UDP-N-acetylglucosamine transferase subunit ALG14 homolog [Cylas formicarius]